MQSFFEYTGESLPLVRTSLLSTPSNGRSVAAPVTPGLLPPTRPKQKAIALSVMAFCLHK